MRVLFVQPIIPHYRKDIVSLLLELKDFESYFVSSDEYLTNTSTTFESYRVINNLKYAQFKFLGYRFYWLKGVMNKIKEISPDVIVLTGFNIYMLHSFPIVMLCALLGRCKLMWWSHGNIGTQGAIGKWMRAIMYKKAHGILAYSKAGMANLISLGVHKDKIRSISNSIPKKDYAHLRLPIVQHRTDKRITDTINMIIVGKLTPAKKIHFGIEATKKLTNKGYDVKLDIIGDGVEGERLEDLIEQLDLADSVTLHKPMYGKALDPYMLRADVYLLPGSVGLSIVHAFSYGLPLVTTDDQHIHAPEIEIFTNQETGLLYHDGEVSDLASKVVEVQGNLKSKKYNYAQHCIDAIHEHNYLPTLQADEIRKHILKTAKS